MKLIKRFLISFLGLNDGQQRARTAEISNYVHDRKNTYAKEMLKIQIQAKKVHHKTKQAHEESTKLNNMVEDITYQIAVATGGMDRTKI